MLKDTTQDRVAEESLPSTGKWVPAQILATDLTSPPTATGQRIVRCLAGGCQVRGEPDYQ